ncbi:hypothetical protein PMAYCL1PPCAC_03027, partial [Pristionchus mayeri]
VGKMPRLIRPTTAGGHSGRNKKPRTDRSDANSSDSEEEELPRRSARIAAKKEEAKVAAPVATPRPKKVAVRKETLQQYWQRKQGELDRLVADFYVRMDGLYLPNTHTLEVLNERWHVALMLIQDIEEAERSYITVNTDAVRRALEDCNAIEDDIAVEIHRKTELARRREIRRRKKEEKEMRRRILEEVRRKAAEETRGGGAAAMSEEEKEARKRERDRLNEEIGKECRICLDEKSDPVGCILCKAIIGCRACVLDWLKESMKCPLCAREVTLDEIKSEAEMEKEAKEDEN